MTNTDKNVQKVKDIVRENYHERLRGLDIEFSIVYGRVKHLVVDILVKRFVAGGLVPKDQIFVQKHHQKSVAETLIYEAKDYSIFMKRIITGDQI